VSARVLDTNAPDLDRILHKIFSVALTRMRYTGYTGLVYAVTVAAAPI
jgi:hypothetical protein